MKTAWRFFRHDGVYRPMCCLFESLTRSAAFRPGPGQTFRTHRKFLRPTHRRDEPRPVIPQRVARQHCPPPLHRHAHPKTVPGSGTMDFQRTVNSVLTVCLSPGDNPRHSHQRFRRRQWLSVLLGTVSGDDFHLPGWVRQVEDPGIAIVVEQHSF
jgi:hypothetical protein